jgi:RNA polymerase sigma-70 factor (ECF subfamily)
MDWSSLPPPQLFQACGEPDSASAWQEFMRRYHAIVTAAAIRVSRQWGQGTSIEADDLVQEIYLHFCANNARVLTGFIDPRPEACFAYLKVIATNAARDHFRRRSAFKRGAAQTEQLAMAESIAAPAVDHERRLTLAEIDARLHEETQKTNGERDRAVFKLYYQQGMSAQAISELPGIGLNPKGVEGVLYRLTRAIKNSFEQPQEFRTD